MGRGRSGKTSGTGKKPKTSAAKKAQEAEAARAAEEARRKAEEAAKKAAAERAEREKAEREARRAKDTKKPAQGKVVQQDVIDIFKQKLNVDVSKARDTQFDDRSGFNIDTRELGRNGLNEIRRYLAQNDGKITPNANFAGHYEVRLEDNGASRVKVLVRYVKPKK